MSTLFTSLGHNRKALIGLVLLAGFALMATIGPLVVGDPSASVALPHEAPSPAHLLGTTGLGQDVLAQTVVGARATLVVGVIVGAVAALLSVLVGVTAGYLRGWTDDVLSLLINVFLLIPGMPLAIVIAAFLPPGPTSMIAVLIVTGWPWSARVLRAQTLTLARRDFVAAAQVSGDSGVRIVVRELLPNMASLVMSCMIGTTVYAIGAQVGLEFLGLGDAGTITWGTSLYWAANDSALVTGAWWTFAPAGLCVALAGFAFTMINFGIDEITNPRLTAERGFRARTGLRAALGNVRRSSSHEGSPAGPPTTAALSARHLRVIYDVAGPPAVAVDDVSLEVRPGEILGLAGESGSGKSTFAGGLLRVLRPPAVITAGQVHLGDRDLLAMDERTLRRVRWRDAAMVFQSAMSALNPVLTIEAQLLDTIRAHEPRTPRPVARARAAALLELVGLPGAYLGRFPHELSGGMRQRAGIAIALALSPRILVMDEPTTALDVVVQREILDRLRALRDQRGLAILLITHDLPMLLEIADRIGIMYAGELVELAPVATLARGARHPYTKGLLAAFPALLGPTDQVREIPGAPPNLGALPPGCRFEPRCPVARASCRDQRPPLRDLGDGALVACPVAADAEPA